MVSIEYVFDTPQYRKVWTNDVMVGMSGRTAYFDGQELCRRCDGTNDVGDRSTVSIQINRIRVGAGIHTATAVVVVHVVVIIQIA